MNILVVGKNQHSLYTIRSQLETEGHTVYSTTSTLQAIEMVKSISIAAIICEYQIQIVDGLKFPHWISSETGFLPPYFIVSEEISEEDVKNHENAEMITGLYRTPEELGQLKLALGSEVHH